MALIEIEVRRQTFGNLLKLITSAAAIPAPSFAVLGNDRLIGALTWTAISVGDIPPGFVPPPGMLTARAELNVGHVSIAELEADAGAALTNTPLVAWLLISLPATSPTILTIAILRLESASGAMNFPTPLRVGFQNMGFGAIAASATSALAIGGEVVTARFASSPTDNVLLPPANRLIQGQAEGAWLVFVSSDVFVAEVMARLNKALSPPPGGASIEDSPYAVWTNLAGGPWRVIAGVGLLKEDACPGVFGSVDLSVAVGVTLSLTPDLAADPPALRLSLAVGSDVSDWDSFRCWVNTGGAAGLLVGLASPFLGLVVGLVSLIAISEHIRLAAGGEVVGTPLGGSLMEVSSTSTSAVYEGTMPLPSLTSDVISADVGEAGLIVRGNVSPLLGLGATHAVTFQPNPGALPGAWHGDFDCKANRWQQHFVVSGVQIRDDAQILGKRYAYVPVRVFPTSRVIPALGWTLGFPATDEVNQFVGVEGGDVVAGSAARAYVHTSAGIRRYALGPVPAPPPAPEQTALVVKIVNCRHFDRVWTPQERIRWLVDPPEFGYDHDPLRQWQIAISEMPEGATLAVHARSSAHQREMPPVRFTARRTGPAAVEIVTDAATEIVLDHFLGETPGGARLSQRWLLPLHVVDLPGAALALSRRGQTVEVLTADRRVTLSLVDWTSSVTERRGHGRSDGAVFSLTLPGGRVVAVCGHRLVVAQPYGRR